ncbi:hypothetical protein [uncultured Deefgea sp.]|uniref:hypothetical protein n=1 Tax=uncultured Deefgea sp. TaxID=1304914 RepID=UPI002592D07A|nr:hypothetical protein [uncultured Deefgea sp.]
MKKTNGIFSCALLALLSACGGGGDSVAIATPAPTVTPSAIATPLPTVAPVIGSSAGLWTGKTNANRTVTTLVLSDGAFYNIYSAAGSPDLIAGVVQGGSTSKNGVFQSSNAKDFNLEGAGVLAVTVSANYVDKKNLNGSISYTDPRYMGSSFVSQYDADFENKPVLSQIVSGFSGWVATSAGTENATMSVSASGAISGRGTSGCTLTGTVIPRLDSNAYDTAIQFGGSPCAFANQTFKGVSYFNAKNNRLYALTLNTARDDGLIFVGNKF